MEEFNGELKPGASANKIFPLFLSLSSSYLLLSVSLFSLSFSLSLCIFRLRRFALFLSLSLSPLLIQSILRVIGTRILLLFNRTESRLWDECCYFRLPTRFRLCRKFKRTLLSALRCYQVVKVVKGCILGRKCGWGRSKNAPLLGSLIWLNILFSD